MAKEKTNPTKPVLVLQTGGKGEGVDYVVVKVFANEELAKEYCRQNTDNPKDEKYWKYCEIITEGKEYEVARYCNYAL